MNKVAKSRQRKVRRVWIRQLLLMLSVLTDFIAFFIVVCTGATLYVYHIPMNQASDAALALVPLVHGNGQLAEILFGIGLLNASLMAASVLPLSTAYSITEAFGWERGIGRKFKEAPQFFFLYTLIITLSQAFRGIGNPLESGRAEDTYEAIQWAQWHKQMRYATLLDVVRWCYEEAMEVMHGSSLCPRKSP